MAEHVLIPKSAAEDWLDMVELLAAAPDWAPDDKPVEIVQTHISVVLLGRQHVLKLKKPVDFGFVDYTTVEKRRMACEAEVSLNRRLCRACLGCRRVEPGGGDRCSRPDAIAIRRENGGEVGS